MPTGKYRRIIETLQTRLSSPRNRRFYAVIGTEHRLKTLDEQLSRSEAPDGKLFPSAVSVSCGIIYALPDGVLEMSVVEEEFVQFATLAPLVASAFESFIRSRVAGRGLTVLRGFELVFGYQLKLKSLQTLTANHDQLILLLPGKRKGNALVLFPNSEQGGFPSPSDVVADEDCLELA